jgi:hypothetical protein
MITRLRSVLQAFATCLSLLAAAPPAPAQVPVVSNLKAVQREGTKLVDITYDLVADTAKEEKGMLDTWRDLEREWRERPPLEVCLTD